MPYSLGCSLSHMIDGVIKMPHSQAFLLCTLYKTEPGGTLEDREAQSEQEEETSLASELQMTDRLDEEENELERSEKRPNSASTSLTWKLMLKSAERTKLMTNNSVLSKQKSRTRGQNLDTLKQFKYFRVIISDDGTR
ncbi:hypothetical protein PoB_003428800 [Plakobranchus ocellatus]|uniref:Uncharacterized protein n=1 Tax=Plakobranchus ocellatus TaxID=259542 RepID=A0AAV4AMI7_9GAST|nr:hypothetical protein PoB_003428800 [Plakobranchus ocellatus]